MLCSGKEWRKLRAIAGAAIFECGGCRLVRVDPFPSEADLRALYATGYFDRTDGIGGYVDYAAAAALKRRSFDRVLDSIAGRFSSSPRLLDVGAAQGLLLELAAARGWDAFGIEPDRAAGDKARSKGLKVVTGMIPAALDDVTGAFDVITLLDTIEHLRDPLAELRTLSGRLRAGGVIVLITPDWGGLFRPLMGAHWPHLKPTEHLWYFRPRTLRKLLEAAGLKEISVRPFFKTVSLDYLLADFAKHGGFFGGAARTLRRLVRPSFPITLYLDEMVAIACGS